MSATKLEILHRLQQLDLGLYGKKREVENFEDAIAKRRREMDEVQKRVDALALRRKDLITRRALAERKIEEQQETLKDRRQRGVRVRTEKELRANQDEVVILQDEVSEGETQLLEVMSSVEEIEAKLAAERAILKDLEQADHRHVDEDMARVEALKAEVESQRDARESIASELDGGLRKRYEIILERRQGLAVVEVRDGNCEGCNMLIPSQLLIEILKTRLVRMCPSCQRILYATPENATGATPDPTED